ncbi:MAG: glycosyltransferase, partial [Clostridia bacterium]|nr:glycosyltransferase [Clostridia bacterium]
MKEMQGKRILMTLTRFDIGGAETHVLELSLELQRMGYYVVVASNGGVYEKNLSDAGIPHYKVPMHSKSPSAVRKSLKLLKNIIKNEHIEIVHAHGRIPAFLCGILKKKMDFTFVTTAHWVFDTSHGLKYITNWGEKVIAVSEDIKTYLIDNYKANPTDIYVTINGIDTNKFSKDADYSDIMEEFSLEPNTKKIVYISRMDEDRALVAFHLAEIVPELVKINPDIEVVIVGGGNVYDKLEARVNEINKKLGKRYIVLT